MRHNKKLNHLSRKTAHRKSMLSNMATSLIMHKRIFTTTAAPVSPALSVVNQIGHIPFLTLTIHCRTIHFMEIVAGSQYQTVLMRGFYFMIYLFHHLFRHRIGISLCSCREYKRNKHDKTHHPSHNKIIIALEMNKLNTLGQMRHINQSKICK
jgi:hypothetical protein